MSRAVFGFHILGCPRRGSWTTCPEVGAATLESKRDLSSLSYHIGRYLSLRCWLRSITEALLKHSAKGRQSTHQVVSQEVLTADVALSDFSLSKAWPKGQSSSSALKVTICCTPKRTENARSSSSTAGTVATRKMQTLQITASTGVLRSVLLLILSCQGNSSNLQAAAHVSCQKTCT